MQGVIWANVGLQQVHIPLGDIPPLQRVRGYMGFEFPSMVELRTRLDDAGVVYTHATPDSLRVVDPIGNDIRCHEQQLPQADAVGAADKRDERTSTWFGPRLSISPLAAALHGASLPGGRSTGLGIKYITFHVPVGAAPKICKVLCLVS